MKKITHISIRSVAVYFLGLFMFSYGNDHQKVQLINMIKHTNPIQPHQKDGYFFNHENENRCKHIIDAAQIFLATKLSLNKYYTDDINNWIKRDIPVQRSQDLRIQWIGHASFLIQINGFNIITDPVFYDLNTILYPRRTPVGIEPSNLPEIDFVIISHNHRDHTDELSLKTLLPHQPVLLVPQGTHDYFANLGFTQVYEHQWWQASTFNNACDCQVEFTFVPAVHWSGRGVSDAHASLWGGWIIKTDTKTVYFAGDTGFDKDIFEAIGRYTSTINCALLPIGPCEPRALMCHSHMSAEESVRAFRVLNASLFIPMHWGTFGLGPDSFDTPIKLLDLEWQKTMVNSDKILHKIKFGESILVS